MRCRITQRPVNPGVRVIRSNRDLFATPVAMLAVVVEAYVDFFQHFSARVVVLTKHVVFFHRRALGCILGEAIALPTPPQLPP